VIRGGGKVKKKELDLPEVESGSTVMVLLCVVFLGSGTGYDEMVRREHGEEERWRGGIRSRREKESPSEETLPSLSS
jgi:hypothetical protein